MESIELTDKDDFGDGCHMASTEPFFYDSAYKLVKKEYACQWEMHHSKEWCTYNEMPRYSSKEPPIKWECSSECKILSDSDVCKIIDLDIVFAGGVWTQDRYVSGTHGNLLTMPSNHAHRFHPLSTIVIHT